MKIQTDSPISASHAAGPNFPEATSADGRFSWLAGLADYVGIRCQDTGLTDNTTGKIGMHQIYLPHGEQDPELSAELLTEARAFAQAVATLQEERREERRREARRRAAGSAPGTFVRRGDPATIWQGPASMDDPDSIF